MSIRSGLGQPEKGRRIAARHAIDLRIGDAVSPHRLEERGWLSSSWGDSENNRKARYYEMTAAGRKQLRAETDNWDRVALAITRALKAT